MIQNKDIAIKKLDEKIKDAEENLGNEEIRDAIIEKAVLYEKNQRSELAIETYQKALELSVGIGKKMEIEFFIMLIYLKQLNIDQLKKHIEIQHKYLLDGGDWEKKNKLKIFEGIYNLMTREFQKTSSLFLSCVTTFNCPEAISYNKFVYYTILTSFITIPRVEIKKKIVHSPDILAAISELPDLQNLLNSYVKCNYKDFFISFLRILEELKKDDYIKPHLKYYIKEMRIMIYSQFMESYKTVKLASMAEAFGVSIEFIDRELSELIAQRRLACKIDKVDGIVESERIDERNNLYKQALKQGDLLLNRVQKLSRVIDL